MNSEKWITDILLHSLVLVRNPHGNATFDRFLESHEEILLIFLFSISLWQMSHFSLCEVKSIYTETAQQVQMDREEKQRFKTLMIHRKNVHLFENADKNRIPAKSDCHVHFRASWHTQLASQTICSYNQVLKNDRHCYFITILILKNDRHCKFITILILKKMIDIATLSQL